MAPGFTDMPSVINGESDLLVQLWGERDRHARVVLGVASLRRAAPVETEVIVRVEDSQHERPPAAVAPLRAPLPVT